MASRESSTVAIAFSLLFATMAMPTPARGGEFPIQTLVTQGQLDFGRAIAIDGDTVVVASRQLDTSPGDVSVYVRQGSQFFRAARLLASDPIFDGFGRSVAVKGGTVVVGAWSVTGGPNGAFVYVRPADGWRGTLTESARLAPSVGAGPTFGAAVAINDVSDVVVSEPLARRAYVFTTPAGGWSATVTEAAKLIPNQGNFVADFGHSIGMSGGVVVTAENFQNSSVFGAAHVHVRPASGWAGTLSSNARIQLESGSGDFADSVAISGRVIVVGASQAQTAFVFEQPSAGWSGLISTPTATLLPSVRTVFTPSFGRSVAIDDGVVIVGAPKNPSSGVDGNAAYKFVRPASGWTGVITETSRFAGGMQGAFGRLVAVEGDLTLISDPLAGSSGNVRGAVHIFLYDITPPTSAVTLGPGAPDGENGWHISNVRALITATDEGGSGVSETRCTLDPVVAPAAFHALASSCGYGGAGVDVTADGQHTLYFASRDRAFNSEIPQSIGFKIDKTAPTTQLNKLPATPDGQSGWYVSDVHVSVTSKDGPGGSGIHQTQCSLDPAVAPTSFSDLPTRCANGRFDLTTDGHHVVYAASKDVAGNVEALMNASVKIDTTAPSVTCGIRPTFLLRAAGATVSATVRDAGSGAASEVITATADLSAAGVKSLSLTGSDVAGNMSTTSCGYIVAYNLLGPFKPFPQNRYRAGAPIQLRFAIADASSAPIADAEAQSLASACRVKVRFDDNPAVCAEFLSGADTFTSSIPVPRSTSSGSHAITIEVLVDDYAVNTKTLPVTIGP